MKFNTSVIDSINRLLDDSEKKCYYKNEQNTKKRQKLWETIVEQAKPNIGIGHEVKGDRELRLLRKLIRKFKMTAHQLRFTELFTRSQMAFIYKDDFAANELRIKEENDADEFNQFGLICCPRRWGKTYIASIFAACLLLAVSGSSIVLYSPSQRQSKYIMDLIRGHLKYLKQFVDWSPVSGKDNQEQLAVQVNGDVRVISGLPANEGTTRGSGGSCIIC